MQCWYPDGTMYSPTRPDERKTSRAFMCWHARLSRLNSAEDVAGRDHVVAHPDRVNVATTMAGQRGIISGRLAPFARALGLRWRRRQEPRRRLIDGGGHRVTQGCQQISGFLKAKDCGFDVRRRIVSLSH
jgi:hypothetical protein